MDLDFEERVYYQDECVNDMSEERLKEVFKTLHLDQFYDTSKLTADTMREIIISRFKMNFPK